MADQATDGGLSQPQRMKVFRALVEAQDAGMSLLQSRQAVAQRYGMTERQVRPIEKEGLDAGWPPL